MRGRLAVGGSIFLAMLLVSSSPLAEEPGSQEEVQFLQIDDAKLRIKVDRTMGLVPLTVKIVGDLRGEQRDATLAPDQHVFVEVESSYVRVVGGDRFMDLGHGGVAELDSSGVERPMEREIVIKTPGTYHFRIIVRDEDGNALFSNKVKVRAM